MKPSLPLLLILAPLLSSTVSIAQTYDSDSIYYTPLQRKAPATVERNVRVFRDTTMGGKLVEYYFDMNIGMLAGCRDCGTGTEFTFSTATTHGVTLGRKTRLGAGVGFDTYVGWKTLPLFGAVSYDIAGTKNTHAIFVEFQYGYGFAWYTVPANQQHPTDVNGGQVFAILAGYRVRYHNLRVAISAGFKQQSSTTIYETDNWVVNEKGGVVRGTPNITTVKMDMGRAELRLAFSWK